MLALLFHDMDPEELVIPVSLSPDLRKMAVLHSVVTASDGHLDYQLEQLDNDALEQENQYIRANPHLCLYGDAKIRNSRWQQTLFSPSGSRLAVIQAGDTYQNENGDDVQDDGTVVLYSNDHPQGSSNSWIKTGQIGPFSELGGGEIPIVFHPLETGLVVFADEKTFFWRFPQPLQNSRGRQDDLLEEIYPRLLHSITFTESGRYLFGVCDKYDTVRITIPTTSADESSQPDVCTAPNGVHVDDTPNDDRIMVADTVNSLSHAQGLLDISLSSAGDAVRSTIVRKDDNDSVILTSLTTDGREQEAILLHIPESISRTGVSPTLLNPMGDSPTIHLVLNKAAQHTYSFREPQSAALPIVVERQKKTIDTTISNLFLGYLPDEDGRERKRRRI